MHKAVEHLIELFRVTFADIPTPLDGPTQHMRSASRSANSLSMEGAVHEEIPSTTTLDLASSAEPSLDVRSTITPEPARPIFPRRSERLLQPLQGIGQFAARFAAKNDLQKFS
jgi:hypothetical protein